MLESSSAKRRTGSADPAPLRRLISGPDRPASRMALDVDVKGDAYEGLLERNAEDLNRAPVNTSFRAR